MKRILDMAIAATRAIYSVAIDTPPVLDARAIFPGAAVLETAWRDIRDEAARFVNVLHRVPKVHEIVERQDDIVGQDEVAWRYVSLRAFGHDHAANARLCPVTAGALGSLPGIINAGFSILDPGKHILPHRGPYGGMLRYHLGLVVPEDAEGRSLAALRVADGVHSIVAGQGLLFDDLREHEAWNRGASPRVNLLVDIPRPGLPRPLRALDRAIMGFVSNSPKIQEFLDKSEIDLADDGAADDGSVKHANA